VSALREPLDLPLREAFEPADQRLGLAFRRVIGED
jgi:hypothetical protein